MPADPYAMRWRIFLDGELALTERIDVRELAQLGDADSVGDLLAERHLELCKQARHRWRVVADDEVGDFPPVVIEGTPDDL